MGCSVDELTAELPNARRLKVEATLQLLAREMIDHADSHGEIRNASSNPQVEVARELGVSQVEVAHPERSVAKKKS